MKSVKLVTTTLYIFYDYICIYKDFSSLCGFTLIPSFPLGSRAGVAPRRHKLSPELPLNSAAPALGSTTKKLSPVVFRGHILLLLSELQQKKLSPAFFFG